MGVHACVSRHKGREASLQERATQPGSLGLGAGSGSPTLSLSHADYGTRRCARERKAKGDLGGCRSHRLEVRPRSSPLTVDCSPLGPLRIQACARDTQPSHEHPHGPAPDPLSTEAAQAWWGPGGAPAGLTSQLSN